MLIDPRGDPTQAPDIKGGVVRLLVGANKEEIVVPECILRSRSAFFDAALKKCWQEGTEKSVSLVEESLTIVTLYIQHLYSDKIYLTKTMTVVGLSEKKGGIPEYPLLAEIYVFGERVQDSTFKNAVIDAFMARMTEPLDYHGSCFPLNVAIDTIYKGTTAGSLARQLMVDVHVSLGVPEWITSQTEENNKDFLMDLSRALLKRPKAVLAISVEMDMSKYHEVLTAKRKRAE